MDEWQLLDLRRSLTIEQAAQLMTHCAAGTSEAELLIVEAIEGGDLPADVVRWGVYYSDLGAELPNGNINVTQTTVKRTDLDAWLDSISVAPEAKPRMSQLAEGGAPDEAAAPMPTETMPAADPDEELAALFDSVRVATLETMFPDESWKHYAEKAARNGLATAARQGRARFNPYRAAQWWFKRGPSGWTWERCLRVLARNLPTRSLDSKHLLTGELD